ncbi:MAG: phenylalanine--tRNA ligase subunit beta, partial [Butyricicoccus sp.]
IKDYVTVQVDEPELCPRYTAKIVKNIKIEPSPAWMRERLFAAGVRPINNIVDITNYVMLEYGQPMHAFDYACLSDGKIVVRRPQPGEAIQTLDGQDRAITPEMLAICDGSKPVAIAGVMGGANSEITDATKTVVFESACFHGATIRITAKALGMRTEASGRFEKGLDASLTMPALLRACELVEELGAGEVIDGVVDVCAADLTPKTLPFEPDKMNALLGTDLSSDAQKEMLERLEFKVEGDKVVIPSFRIDIARMCDLAEEVARMFGYDNIPVRLYAGDTTQGGLSPRQQMERAAAGVCLSAGFDESMSHSFISPKFYDAINLPADDVRRISTTILNPLGEDFSVMRTTVLPSMLDSLSHNNAHRNPTASLYELGTIYTPVIKDGKADAEQLPHEEKILTLGSYGRLSFFQFKGVIEALCRELNIKDVSFAADTENPSYHPGRCAKIYAGETLLGTFGTVHPVVAKKYGFTAEVLAAELTMDALFACTDPVKRYQPLPKFPASTRDIAVLVDDAVPAASMQKAIEKAAGVILESVKLFDVYKGKGIPEGKKSVAYSMSLRAADRTLTDDECDKAMKKAIEVLEQQFSAVLRG